MAAASITKHTKAVVVVVSESSSIRVFDAGQIFAEIIPELWLLSYLPLNGAAIIKCSSSVH
jgi:hypothetical protein